MKVSAIEPGVIRTPIFDKAVQDLPDPDSPYVGNRRLGEWFMYSLFGTPAPPDAGGGDDPGCDRGRGAEAALPRRR